jgi:hypothetical protein
MILKTRDAQNIFDWTHCPLSDESCFLACSTSWLREDAKLNYELVYRDEDNQSMSAGLPYPNFQMGFMEV